MTIRILSHVKAMLSHPLQAAIKRHYSLHIFNAHARLDVPTYDDVAVQTQLEAASQIGGQSIAWVTVNTVFGLMSTMLHMVSQLTVLWGVLKEQRDGLLLAALSCIQVAFEWVEWQHRSPLRDGGNLSLDFFSLNSRPIVWAATTKNSDYIKLQGLKRVVTEFIHRKEFVAGNLSRYMISRKPVFPDVLSPYLTLRAVFRHLSNRVGDDADNFWPTVQSHRAREKLTIFSLLKEPFSELPQVGL